MPKCWDRKCGILNWQALWLTSLSCLVGHFGHFFFFSSVKNLGHYKDSVLFPFEYIILLLYQSRQKERAFWRRVTGRIFLKGLLWGDVFKIIDFTHNGLQTLMRQPSKRCAIIQIFQFSSVFFPLNSLELDHPASMDRCTNMLISKDKRQKELMRNWGEKKAKTDKKMDCHATV